MLFNFGTKRVDTPVGRVADFCAFCRAPRAMSVLRVGKTVTWYGMPLGKGDLQEHVLWCEACGARLTVDLRRYATIDGKRGEPLPALAARTFPDLEQAWAVRLEQEARLRHGPEHLDDTERAALLKQPFFLLANEVERAFDSPPNDNAVAMAFVAACCLPFVGIFLALELEARGSPQADAIGMSVAAGGFLLGIIAVVVMQFRASDRHLQRELLPRIARTLRPLEPTEADLAEAMADLPAYRHRAGHRRLLPAMVAAQLHADVAALAPPKPKVQIR